MTKATSPRRVYLDILGFQSTDELANHITLAIREAIRDQRGDIIPVAVSAAAHAFGIRPEPTFGEPAREGAIQFDAREDKFVIRINQSRPPNTIPRAFDYDDEISPELSLLYRSRFTYAHEFAHRFFFVQADSAWRRALDIATQDLDEDKRRVAFRNLYNYEEMLCNRIAGDVLVPEAHLLRILGNCLGEIDGLHLDLRKASYAFRVSQECLLVRIKRAVLDSQMSCPPNLCILLITRSDRKGGESRARRDLRIRESIMPAQMSGVSVKKLFTGLALRNLGHEALSASEAAVASKPGSYPSPVNLTIDLASSDGSGVIKTRLTGWIRCLYSGHEGRSAAEGLLLWGLLDSV